MKPCDHIVSGNNQGMPRMACADKVGLGASGTVVHAMSVHPVVVAYGG